MWFIPAWPGTETPYSVSVPMTRRALTVISVGAPPLAGQQAGLLRQRGPRARQPHHRQRQTRTHLRDARLRAHRDVGLPRRPGHGPDRVGALQDQPDAAALAE